MPDTPTTRLNLYKSASDGSEDVDYTQDIGDNWDAVDLAVGALAVTTSTFPSTPWNGQIIRDTSTSRLWVSNGSTPASGSWSEICTPKTVQTFTAGIALTRSSASDIAVATATTAAGQRMFGVGADGKLQWGSGSAAEDTNLYRSAANTLKTDDDLVVVGDITADNYQELMGWTALASLGTFSTNFSAHPTQVPRMRKVDMLGTVVWQFEGRIVASAFAANSVLSMFTFSSSTNFPAAERGAMTYASGSGFYAARVGLTAAGVLQAGVPTAAGTLTTGVWLDGFIITNPV